MTDWGVIPNKLKLEENNEMIFTVCDDTKYLILTNKN